MRTPNFANLLAVLRREVPERPTLFEFFLNGDLNARLTGIAPQPDWTLRDYLQWGIASYHVAGYDYFTVHGSDFGFKAKEVAHGASRSMNDTAVIFDRASFDAYDWPDPNAFDYSRLETAELPAGMRLIAFGPGGVLENVMQLAGYEGLCYMLLDDPDLVQELFAAVGSRLVRYYEICRAYPKVGALISNDDWGFNTQTMLAPEEMRKYVFPWHTRIVETIHAAGKPAILHSCGRLEPVMDDIIDGMGYDAKHSYEDNIMPVEEAYERWGSRIAIFGGIDVDFVCRATPAEVAARSRAMLQRTATRGGYALGTGNSVPAYVPADHYLAMINTVREDDDPVVLKG